MTVGGMIAHLWHGIILTRTSFMRRSLTKCTSISISQLCFCLLGFVHVLIVLIQSTCGGMEPAALQAYIGMSIRQLSLLSREPGLYAHNILQGSCVNEMGRCQHHDCIITPMGKTLIPVVCEHLCCCCDPRFYFQWLKTLNLLKYTSRYVFLLFLLFIFFCFLLMS